MNADTELLIFALEPFSLFGEFRNLLEDSSISVISNNPDGRWWVRKHGQNYPAEVEVAPETLTQSLVVIAQRFGRPLDRSHPILNIALPGGGELAVVMPPIVSPHPAVTIHKFPIQTNGGTPSR